MTPHIFKICWALNFFTGLVAYYRHDTDLIILACSLMLTCVIADVGYKK